MSYIIVLRFHCHSFCSCIHISTFSFSSASVGISFLQFTNLNSMRNLIIIGLTLFLGISVPQLFNQSSSPSRPGYVHTKAGWVSFHLSAIFSCSKLRRPYSYTFALSLLSFFHLCSSMHS
jgi:formate hydrogenlyase subunit 4